MLTRNNCPAGEFWIDDSGYATYADTDFGDESHESIAYRAMIDFEQVAYEMVHLGHREDRRYDEDNAIADYFDGQIDVGVLEEVVGREKLKDINEDVRWAYVIHENAIRVKGGEFEVKKINKETITRIKDFLEEEYNGSGIDPECTINIEELLPSTVRFGSPHFKRKHATISFRDLMKFVETPSDLRKIGLFREI